MSEFDFDEVRPRAHEGPGGADPVGGGVLARSAPRRHRAGRATSCTPSSTSGIYANPGQSNYGSAKSGIVTFSQIAAKELARYGVVSNCVVPGARTRLDDVVAGTARDHGGAGGRVRRVVTRQRVAGGRLPRGASCPFTGETFYVQGGTVRRLEPWSLVGRVDREPGRARPLDELDEAMKAFEPRRPLTR